MDELDKLIRDKHDAQRKFFEARNLLGHYVQKNLRELIDHGLIKWELSPHYVRKVVGAEKRR